jgi:predicted nucleic acid-binding protein
MIRIYLDACAIIYLLEGEARFRSAVISRMQFWTKDPATEIITSRLSRIECRVGPLKSGNTRDLQRYEIFLASKRIKIVDVSAPIIERATSLRVSYGFETLDALHLATAVENMATVFLSGDAQLQRCSELKVDVVTP